MLERVRDADRARTASPTSRRPNVLTLAPKGAERSGNPWHVREYRAEEFRALCERTSARSSCSACSTPAGCAPTSSRSSGRLGPRARGAAHHAPVLRPLHAGDLDARLRAAGGRPGARARPPGRAAAMSPARRAGDRPAHAHALRRGLRDVAVRRGVAVGGDRDLLPAAARRARRGARPHHAVADAGARRPARGARRARALPRVPARRARRDPPPRHRGGRDAGRRGASSSARPRATRAAADALRGAPRRPRARASRRTRLDLGGDARGAAAAGDRRRRAPAAGDRDRRAPGALRRLGRRAVAARVRATRRGSTRRSRRPACTPRASTSPTCSAGLDPLRPLRTRRGPAARPDRPGDRSSSCGARRLPVRAAPTATRTR